MRNRVCVSVGRPSISPSVCPTWAHGSNSSKPAARRYCWFAAVSPDGRRYRSIAARPARRRSAATARRSTANAGSATLSACVVAERRPVRVVSFARRDWFAVCRCGFRTDEPSGGSDTRPRWRAPRNDKRSDFSAATTR